MHNLYYALKFDILIVLKREVFMKNKFYNKVFISGLLITVSILFSIVSRAEDKSRQDDGSRKTLDGAVFVSDPDDLDGVEKFPCGKGNRVSHILQNNKDKGLDLDTVVIGCFKRSDVQHKFYKTAKGTAVTRSGKVITYGVSKEPDFQQDVYDFDKISGEQWVYVIDKRTEAVGRLFIKINIDKKGNAKQIYHDKETVKLLQKYFDTQSEE
jgi:hypothetical protein